MHELERRLIHLEARVHYELRDLHRRIEHVEARPDLTRVLSLGSIFKLLLAILLPLAVLVATGDWAAAVKAARMAGGMGAGG